MTIYYAAPVAEGVTCGITYVIAKEAGSYEPGVTIAVVPAGEHALATAERIARLLAEDDERQADAEGQHEAG